MSLTIAVVQSIWMVLGKGIFLNNLVLTQGTALESLMVGLAEQVNDGYDPYGSMQSTVVPANTAVKAIIAKVQGGTATAQAICENYLQNEAAVQLGLVAGTDIPDILDALRSQVVANGQYITAGGLFDVYIRATWDYTDMPTTPGSSIIPDTYVTDAIQYSLIEGLPPGIVLV